MSTRRLIPSLLPALIFACAGTASTPASGNDASVDLGHHLERLEANPSDRDARLGAWRAAVQLGLFEQAAALQAPLSDAEQRSQENDRLALQIRYGVIDANTLRGSERFAALDRALAATDADATAFLGGAPADAEALRRLIDRVSALSGRRRATEALALYDALLARGATIPDWIKRDVADSALQVLQPERAIALYRSYLTHSPDDFAANIGLFYALSDAGDLDAATTHIDAYAQRLPERRHRDGRYNGERLSADIAADQARSYAGQLNEASQRSETRLAASPFNAEARGAAASLALARGWPHRGEETLRRTLGSDPSNPSLYADLAETRLQLYDPIFLCCPPLN